MAAEPVVDGFDDGFGVEQCAASGIDAQCDGMMELDLFTQRKSLREQHRRQIVHTLIAAVLEMLEDAGFACAG